MMAIRMTVLALVLFNTLACANEYPLGLPETAPEKVGLSTDRLSRIREAFAEPVAEGKIPGLITVVARHGKIAHFETHGYADQASKKPLQPDTLFRIYSMTKPIIGVGMMLLYEQGHFDLDDPVSRFIPEFSSMKVHASSGLKDLARPITIRHVMTHTSGLVDAYMPNPISERYKAVGLDAEWSTMMSGITLQDYVHQMAQQPLLFQPGEQWYYGMNMTVLGRLIEIIARQPLSEYLQEKIFQPLQMHDTAYYVPATKLNRLAPIYKSEDGRLIDISGELGYNQKPSLELGDTGLVSTAVDYLRFAQMLLNGGELDGIRILNPETVSLMTKNHLPDTLGASPLRVLKGYPVADREGMGYGITMAVVTDAGAAGSAGSTGEFTWGGGANTEFWIDPGEQVIGLIFMQLRLGWLAFPVRDTFHELTYSVLKHERKK